MEITRALSQIRDIHQHLARTEYYRGYRSQTMAFTGIVALAGALLLPVVLPGLTATQQIYYWVTLALFNLTLVGADIGSDWFRYTTLQRKMTTKVVGQFLPCLTAGAVLTVLFCGSANVDLLPGLWALLFSMGVFASRPYLPQGIGWVALFYLVAGSLLVGFAEYSLVSPWVMASVFGPGQLFMSAILYWNLERSGSSV